MRTFELQVFHGGEDEPTGLVLLEDYTPAAAERYRADVQKEIDQLRTDHPNTEGMQTVYLEQGSEIRVHPSRVDRVVLVEIAT